MTPDETAVRAWERAEDGEADHEGSDVLEPASLSTLRLGLRPGP